MAVRSRSQHSRFAVSNVSLSSSGDSIDNSNHELLTSQTGLTRQCQVNNETKYVIITAGSYLQIVNEELVTEELLENSHVYAFIE